MRQRTFLLWTTVEQRKERETAAWRVAAAENGLAGSGPYEAHLLAAQSGLENDDEMLVQAEQEILKDVKRTFPWLENYGEREAATRNVLLAYAFPWEMTFERPPPPCVLDPAAPRLAAGQALDNTTAMGLQQLQLRRAYLEASATGERARQARTRDSGRGGRTGGGRAR